MGRAVVFSIAWLAAGVLIRVRFRVGRCDESEGAWALAIYVLLSAAIVVWAKVRQGDFATEHERPYRVLSRFIRTPRAGDRRVGLHRLSRRESHVQ